jgi:hypothetical protein
MTRRSPSIDAGFVRYCRSFVSDIVEQGVHPGDPSGRPRRSRRARRSRHCSARHRRTAVGDTGPPPPACADGLRYIGPSSPSRRAPHQDLDRARWTTTPSDVKSGTTVELHGHERPG